MSQEDAKKEGKVILSEEELLAIFGGTEEEYNPYGEWDDDDPKRYWYQLSQYCGTKETAGECRPPLCFWRGMDGCVGYIHQSVAGGN